MKKTFLSSVFCYGTIAGWYQQICAAIYSLATIPFYLHFLGSELAGVWFFFQVLAAAVLLVDYGLSFVFARQYSYTLSKTQSGLLHDNAFLGSHWGWQGAKTLLHTNRRIFFIIALLSGSVWAFIAWGINFFPVLHLQDNPATTAMFWWGMALTTAFALLARPSFSCLEGSGRIAYARFLQGTHHLAQGLAIGLVLMCGGQLTALSWTLAGVTLLFWLVAHLYVNRLRQFRFVTSYVPRMLTLDEVRHLWKQAWPMGTTSLGAFMVSMSQVPLLALTQGPQNVTSFYLAQRIGQFLNQGVTSILAPHLPRFTQLIATGDYDQARRKMQHNLKVITICTLLTNIFFAVASPYLVKIFLPNAMYIDTITLVLLALDYTLLGATVAWGHFVVASGRNPFLWVTLASGGISLLLGSFLIDKIGLTALPLATLLAGLCTTYWLSLREGCRLYRSLWQRSN